MGLHYKNQEGEQMEWIKEALKGLVDDEKLNEVAVAIEKGVPKHFIPKNKFNEINDELKLTKAQLEETNGKIVQLSQQASSLEEYKLQIENLKKENESVADKYKAQVEEVMKKSREEVKKVKLKESLLDSGVHKDAIDLLVEKYSTEVPLTEEGFGEIKPLIDKIKTEKAGLFVIETQNSVERGSGKANPPKQDDTDLRKLFGL